MDLLDVRSLFVVFIDVVIGGRGAVGVCKTLQHRLAEPHSAR